MASPVAGPVRVTVPATSANLGPGFDSLGLALSLRDEVTAEVAGTDLLVEVSGEGAADVPRDGSHLVVQAMREAFAQLGGAPAGLVVRCTNVIPHGRGLGSSAAAIVAGVTLARGLVAGGAELMDDDAVFQLAARLEGHPDNVAPAFFGGFVISGEQDGRYYAAPSAVDARVTAVVFVPPTAVATTLARGLLPATISFADAAANSGRTALLVAALAARPELLLAATRDFLHQDYREPAMPESLSLVRALRADGIPATVSGAGPTVLAFCVDAGSREALVDRCPPGWAVRHLFVETDGVLLT